MVANIVASVPVILLQHRKEGAITSMIIATIVGITLIFIITRFFNAFPGMTLPDLLKKTMSKWIYTPILIYIIVVWFLGGLITLITYTILLIRFITPDMSLVMGTIIILPFISLGCMMATDRILYTVELVLVVTFPLLLFIFVKSYLSNEMEWDYVKIAITHINQAPNFLSLMATSFLFLGVANLIIFNRFFMMKQKFGLKQLLVISLLGIGVLFTTYFIPIGFNGFENVGSVTYPWIATSDALRIKYGVIERVVFVFLLFYLAVSVISILIHWHVVVELLKYMFDFNKLKIKNIRMMPVIIVLMFVAISIFTISTLNEYDIYKYTGYYFLQFAILVPILLIVLWFIRRRLKHEKQP